MISRLPFPTGKTGTVPGIPYCVITLAEWRSLGAGSPAVENALSFDKDKSCSSMATICDAVLVFANCTNHKCTIMSC